MGVLKIAKTSDLTAPCEITDTFTVLVRHLTPTQYDALITKCTRLQPDPDTGERKRRIDINLWCKLAPDALIDSAGCSGLTPSALRSLGLLLDEDPPLNEAGEIDCTPEVLRELWRELPLEKFQNQILRTSQNIVAAMEAAKKNGSMG